MSSPKEAALIIDQGDGWWSVSDWSPDDEKLTVVQYISINKVNSYIYDLNKNELTQINDNSKEAVFLAFYWDSTGEKIYAITDEEGVTLIRSLYLAMLSLNLPLLLNSIASRKYLCPNKTIHRPPGNPLLDHL